MKNLNKFVEFDFQNYSETDCRFDSSTIELGVVTYKLAIMQWPFTTDAPKLHFSYANGLVSDNAKDTDIVSQLLSIYQIKSSNNKK
ncbi:hypothetical protein [Hespellia stercorisuis]|uniref:Uncharacterized protein n=1 Tax=Hespellia stercorisuis DSM 15480 TaxID=1121950 RepID=A0A1M6XEP2_9FIRM|nr:hypothetical protein [Hespellia stercorisuis]SHL04412.1 hypothetical protein SAMN02745243_04195 [Hespellia stercorisuis DSM 15480]